VSDLRVNNVSSSALSSTSSSPVVDGDQHDDISLSEQLSSSHSSIDTPSRIIASTPAELEKQYKPHRERVLKLLEEELKINSSLSGFCTGEGSVVTLTVKPEDVQHLYTRQYKVAERMKKDVDEIVNNWFKSGRTKLAPDGCRFNSPLLSVLWYIDQLRLKFVCNAMCDCMCHFANVFIKNEL